MAIGRLSYLDLTREQRQEAALGARKKLQEVMAHPFMPAEHLQLMQERLLQVDRWEAGTLPEASPPRSALRFLAPRSAG